MDLSAWTPLRVEDREWLTWWDTTDLCFDDPFWVDTARRRLRNKAAALLQPRTRLTALPQLVARHAALPLAGLIFHWSRSGSTAFVRAAGAAPNVLALSEPPPIDEVLRLGDPDLLTEMVRALTQPRRPEHDIAVIKLDAWSTLELPRFLESLPGIPWVFLWRDPRQVLQSHATRGPGAHMVPGLMDPELFGMSREVAARLPVEDYRATVLRSLARRALDAPRDRATFVEHAHLTERLPEVLSSWGLSTQGIAASLEQDAKQPDSPYVEGSSPVTPATEAACDQHLSTVVEELRDA